MTVQSKHSTWPDIADPEKSPKPGECTGKGSVVSPMPMSRRALLNHARHMSPHQWMKMMRAIFRNPLEVALFFDCDEKTGRNYWNGVGRPTLDRALVAQVVYPDEFRRHMIDGIAAE